MSAPPFPYRMTGELRERLFQMYPVVSEPSRESRRLLVMAVQLLYGPLVWPEEGSPCQLWPRTLQAHLMGLRCPTSCRSGEWLAKFGKQVWPLEVSSYDYTAGRCRTVRAHIEPSLIELRDRALSAAPGSAPDLIDPQSGRAVARRKRKAELEAYYADARAACQIAADHPAAELFHDLNQQDQRPYQQLITRNWPALVDAVLALEGSDTHETALRTLHAIREMPCMLYHPSERTARLHAVGATVHLLRRDLRKIALSGGVTLDLRAAQLAIAAKLWEIGPLYDFLAAGGSIWAELLMAIRAAAAAKPTVKRAVYSACYGMDRSCITRRLKEGREGEPPLTAAQAGAFQKHPLIAALLAAREAQLEAVERAGGVIDPFGRFLSREAGTEARALLAQQNQAMELLIMRAALPTLKQFRRVSTVSWLHDGLTLVGPPADLEACAAAVRAAINTQAEVLEIPTWVE